MGPIEIITIIIAVGIVAAVVITSIVRKAKGKSNGCSGCAGCPYAGSCSGNGKRGSQSTYLSADMKSRNQLSVADNADCKCDAKCAEE